MLISNIIMEFALLKSVKKRDYDRGEMSQLVRARNWHADPKHVISRMSQLPEHKIQVQFQEDAVFYEFAKFVVFEFSLLAIPTGTLLGTLSRPYGSKTEIILDIRVRDYCKICTSDPIGMESVQVQIPPTSYKDPKPKKVPRRDVEKYNGGSSHTSRRLTRSLRTPHSSPRVSHSPSSKHLRKQRSE